MKRGLTTNQTEQMGLPIGPHSPQAKAGVLAPLGGKNWVAGTNTYQVYHVLGK